MIYTAIKLITWQNVSIDHKDLVTSISVQCWNLTSNILMAFLTPPLWGSKRRTHPRCSLTTLDDPPHRCWRTCYNSLPSCPKCPSCGCPGCPSCLKPHLHALKNRHCTPSFWHCADDLKARHSLFSTCKCIGPKCNVAPVLKISGVPRLSPGGTLGMGKQGTVSKIWCAVLIF